MTRVDLTTTPHPRRSGVVLAIGAAILFGLSTPLAKLLLQAVSPQMLAGMLYLGSGIGVGAYCLVGRARGRRPEAPLTRHDAPWLAGAVLAGGVIGPLLLMLGLARTAASGTSLLLNLEGVFTALLAWFAFRENFDRRIALGMLAIIAGGALLSWQGRLAWGGLVGPLAICGACLAWGLDNNLTQKVSASDPVPTTAIKGLVAGAVNVAIALIFGNAWPDPEHVGAALVLGLVSYGVSVVLYVRALRELGTARTGAYFSLAPFVGAVVSVIVWREAVTLSLALAAVLMALGVWLHVSERHDHEHLHGLLVHEHLHVHDEHHRHEHGPDDPLVEPHSHPHRHEPLKHAHQHYPDIHHRHSHDQRRTPHSRRA